MKRLYIHKCIQNPVINDAVILTDGSSEDYIPVIVRLSDNTQPTLYDGDFEFLTLNLQPKDKLIYMSPNSFNPEEALVTESINRTKAKLLRKFGRATITNETLSFYMEEMFTSSKEARFARTTRFEHPDSIDYTFAVIRDPKTLGYLNLPEIYYVIEINGDIKVEINNEYTFEE